MRGGAPVEQLSQADDGSKGALSVARTPPDLEKKVRAVRSDTVTSRTARDRGGRYLDMQAEVGISKHLGGLPATARLLELCHADQASSLLDVGCGIGVGPVYVAKRYDCRVTGVDLSPRMVRWARQRARQAGVADLIGLFVGDVSTLPFPDDSFDVVICESVLDFVPETEVAVRECVRVAKPGGWVGVNEALWLQEPPPGTVQQLQAALDVSIPSRDAWRALWEASGLEDRSMEVYQVGAREETLRRIDSIGWSWLLNAWGRAIRLLLTDPAARRAFRQQLRFPAGALRLTGYGLMAGRKPLAG